MYTILSNNYSPREYNELTDAIHAFDSLTGESTLMKQVIGILRGKIIVKGEFMIYRSLNCFDGKSSVA